VAGRIAGEAGARIGADAFTAAYAEGKALPRDAAVRRLDPAGLLPDQNGGPDRNLGPN
jgi:hypothetical protein